MTQIYAHRGGAGLYPENSLIAIENSLKLGVDFIDMDIVMNRNHIFMVLHDPFLDENIVRDENNSYIKGSQLLVKNLSTEKLKHFDVGRIKPHSTLAKQYPEQQSFDDVKIPTLEEAITTILHSPLGRRTSIQIEIKASAYRPSETFPLSQIIKQLVKILKKYSIENRVEIQSFNWKALRLLQKELPSIKTAYLHMNPCPYKKNQPIILSPIWTNGYLPKDYDGSLLKMIKSLGGHIWGPHFIHVTKKLVEEAHQYDLKVVPWTIDDENTMQHLIDCRVDGIITNRPDLLKNVLKRVSFKK